MNNLHTCTHNHIVNAHAINNISLQIYVNRRDPTHTTTLRDRFAKDLTKRFRELRGVIRKAVDREDCFGLKEENNYGLIFQQAKMTTPGKKAFKFRRSPEKVQGFMAWLKEQVDTGILEVTERPTPGIGIEPVWTNHYIQQAYKSGIIHARANLRREGYVFPEIEDIYETQIPFPDIEAIDAAYVYMDSLHVDRVGLLFSRTYNDLKGITDTMDAQISRVLSQGLIAGKHPFVIAKELTRTISGPVGDLGIKDTLGRFIPAERRAKMLARSEIIRAHASATVQEYRRLGIEDVRLKAEWLTGAGACESCLSMEARNPYTLNQIDGLIPYHPQCRCTILPLLPKKYA